MGTFVYVGNLDFSTTEDQVRAAFTSAGTPIRSVVILRSPQNGRSRGFGFVELGSEDEAAVATRSVNGVEIGGRPMKVGPTRERAPVRGPGTSFQSYSGLGRSPGGPRRPGGGGARNKRK